MFCYDFLDFVPRKQNYKSQRKHGLNTLLYTEWILDEV